MRARARMTTLFIACGTAAAMGVGVSTAIPAVAATADPPRSVAAAVAAAKVSGCTITGTKGDDVLRGTSGPDVICARGGDDEVYGLGGDDVLLGGSGDDQIRGGSGNDVVSGEAGDDDLAGGPGEDDVHEEVGATSAPDGVAEDVEWTAYNTTHGYTTAAYAGGSCTTAEVSPTFPVRGRDGSLWRGRLAYVKGTLDYLESCSYERASMHFELTDDRGKFGELWLVARRPGSAYFEVPYMVGIDSIRLTNNSKGFTISMTM